MMKKDFWILKNDDEAIEILLCPYCGSRLNRVNTNLLPTSCHECLHQRFVPKILMMKEVKPILDEKKKDEVGVHER